MAGAARRQTGQNNWLVGAGWMAGVSIVLVEMQVGVDYVQARLAEQAHVVAGWLPMIGTLSSRLMGSVLLPGSPDLQLCVPLLIFAAIPAGLVAAWLIKGRAVESRGGAR